MKESSWRVIWELSYKNSTEWSHGIICRASELQWLYITYHQVKKMLHITFQCPHKRFWCRSNTKDEDLSTAASPMSYSSTVHPFPCSLSLVLKLLFTPAHGLSTSVLVYIRAETSGYSCLRYAYLRVRFHWCPYTRDPDWHDDIKTKSNSLR